MRAAPEHIEGVERVVRAFGYWPSFHDAKLRGVHHDGSGRGAVMLTLEAFEMTHEVEERVLNGVMGRYFRQTKHHDVCLRFDDVAEVVLPKHDDALDVLEIGNERDGDGRFLVVLESVVGAPHEGFGGSFRARSGAVVDVVATSPEAK
jgi:hypothetical protein